MTTRNISKKEYDNGFPPVTSGDPIRRDRKVQQIKVKGAHWKNAVHVDMGTTDFPHKDGPLDAWEMKLLHKLRQTHGPIFRRLMARLEKHGHDAA